MTYAMTPDGTRIAYQLQGQGAPVVLLANQADSHHWWDAVRAGFHPARSTLTLDYRGIGGQTQPQSGAARQALLELMYTSNGSPPTPSRTTPGGEEPADSRRR